MPTTLSTEATAWASEPAAGADLDGVEAAASASAGAMARFEFEATKGNEGSKILMVDWDITGGQTEPSSTANGDWEISWEGKATVLPAIDAAKGPSRRVFFLLPPSAPIPPVITIAQVGGPTLRAKPMPAIFVPALGLNNGDVGKRGVLHTIWAKKRLSELQAEMDREMRANGESVGLEMALQERHWILDHFGLGDDANPSSPLPPLPQSPRSPIGGRLGEKLKGLKLATSPAELSPAYSDSRTIRLQSLSPDPDDVAISSFSSFSERARAGRRNPGGGTQALDALLRSHQKTTEASADIEEGLFVLPMSPRSPEMAKSPFSLLNSA